MSSKRVLAVLGVAAVLCFAGRALAGEDGGGRRGGGPGGGADFRAAMMDRIKQNLGVTDEEWKVLQPRIQKVQDLSRQVQGGMMGMFGRRNRGGDAATTAAEQPAPQNDVEKAMQALTKLLADQQTKAEDIKASLTALRDARAKAKEALETAKKELRETLTVRQEAQLVMMSILD